MPETEGLMNLRRERFVSRRWVAVLLGAQLLGACAVPLADARLDAAAAAAEVHVEDAGRGSCVPRHDHQSCVLCQHLAQHATSAASASGPHGLSARPAAAAVGQDRLPRSRPYARSHSRAPPPA